MGTNLANNI
jgi:hypothetical protein